MPKNVEIRPEMDKEVGGTTMAAEMGMGSGLEPCSLSRWTYVMKKDAAGNIVCYKAHLIAQGFSQVLGVDFFDTYAPVTKMAYGSLGL